MWIDVTVTAAVILLGITVALRCIADLGASDRILPFAPALPGSAGEEGPPLSSSQVFAGALGFRLLVLAAMLVCVFLRADSSITLEQCFESTVRWDSRHYIALVEQGYTGYVENGRHLFLVFFPCYVWLVRLLRLVIPNTLAAGLLVSCLCYSWGCCFVYRLGTKLYGGRTARDALLFLSLFPFSFFFGTMMTEGLFLLTTAAACWYASERRWFLFGLWGCLAAATRMTGLLVILPAAVELCKSRQILSFREESSWGKRFLSVLKHLPRILMPLLGTGSYLLLNRYVDGDPFAFAAHQQHWHQGAMWVSQVLRYVLKYVSGGGSVAYAIWIPTLLLFLAVFALLAAAVRDRKNPSGLLLFGFCYFIANYSLSWLLSAGRYLSCGFVLFLFLARITEDRKVLRAGILAVESVFFGVFLTAYLSGAQIM